MNENGDNIQASQSLTFEPLGYLANQESLNDTNESQPLETYANELITNIIKDASQTASKNHDENMDNTNELNFPQTLKTTTTNFDQSEYSTGNGHHDENDSVYEDIQNKMNGVIHDMQSGSTNDFHSSRKSITSNHLNDDQVANGKSSPLPIRQDESSSNIDDIYGIKAQPTTTTISLDDFTDQNSSEKENPTNHRSDEHEEFFNTKVATMDDNQQPTSAIKQTNLDETAHFRVTSSRTPSASSKRSVHVTPDEPSTSGDEKRTEMSPSKLPDDAGNDTDLDNREVANIVRRSSRTMSPLNRPRSPTPNDSLKMSTNSELSPSLPVEHSQSPADLIKDDNETNQSSILSDDNQEKQNFEPPTAIISPPSRRESTNKNNQQETSRPTSATKIKSDENVVEPSISRPNSNRTHQFSVTDEQLKLIKPGEQLQIPRDDLDNERSNSPPPSSTVIKSLALFNPLLGSSLVQNEQDRSRPPSETDRKSPTTSMISNEKIIDGDVLQSKSRRESSISQQQINNTDKKPSSRRESPIIEQTPPISSSHRASTSQQQQDESDGHQKVPSRRTSNLSQEPTSHRDSLHPELQTSSPRESTTMEQKPSSRKSSTASEQKVLDKRASVVPEQQTSSRRESATDEQKMTSRKGSVVSEQHPPSKRGSTVSEKQPPSRQDSTHDEQKIPSRKASTTSEQQMFNKRESPGPERQSSSQRESIHDEPKIASRKASSNSEQKSVGRKESTTSEPQVQSKRPSVASQQQPSSGRESTANDEKTTNRKGSTAIEQRPLSRQENTHDEQKVASRKSSNAAEQQVSSRKQSPSLEEPVSSRRGSHIADQQTTHRRQSSFDQQEPKPPSKAPSRKVSVAEQQQVSSSRRTSANQDNQPISHHRNSVTKQEEQPIPVSDRKDSRRSSLNIHDTNHQPIKHESHTSTKDKRQKSSSTTDGNNRQSSSSQRKSERGAKQNSNLMTDETVVTPIIMDSSKARRQNGKHTSTTDPSYDQPQTSKLPPVNFSLQQEKPRRTEIKHLSSSHPTTGSEDEQASHWTKTIMIPSIHLTDDDEISSSREDQQRPQSPNVDQIAERNQIPSPLIKTASTGKKRSIADTQKRKEHHRPSRRSTSADSMTNIPLVDDKSLDSTSEQTADFERHKRRHNKPKKRDVETNTDQTFDLQRSFFDEKELIPKQPLKATKPMSDHFHSTRRRAPNKEQILTTPDTMPDTDASTVRRTVKQTKDSHQDKDPVHVNVTVVVKKFAGTTKDGKPVTTAEAIVEQKSQQYFETVQQRPETLPAPTETKDELIERSKSTEQQRLQSSEEKILDPQDRHTQSDTEQIITENQKKRRRPKRISRTCQTYEHIFRRMEREEQHDLRTTSDTEKNIQTRKSQLRPRRKSPKKNIPIYLSTDSFRLEDVLPKQYHQSRRNISKSSSIARSLSPQSGKLLILRPTLPFHHTDAVNVQRVCLQYAIDLIPNENLTSTALTNRNKSNVLKNPEQTNNLPMISTSSSGVNIPTTKSNTKDKLSSQK